MTPVLTGNYGEVDRGDDADWPKRTWDFPDIHSADELRAFLAKTGKTPEEFKQSAAYRLAVLHGTAPAWLKDL